MAKSKEMSMGTPLHVLLAEQRKLDEGIRYPQSGVPTQSETDGLIVTLQARVEELEGQVEDLSKENDDLRAQIPSDEPLPDLELVDNADTPVEE